MQMSEIKKLKDSWGNKPCDHPELDKEYILGYQTGDYICTSCGESFLAEQAKKILEKRQNKKI